MSDNTKEYVPEYPKYTSDKKFYVRNWLREDDLSSYSMEVSEWFNKAKQHLREYDAMIQISSGHDSVWLDFWKGNTEEELQESLQMYETILNDFKSFGEHLKASVLKFQQQNSQLKANKSNEEKESSCQKS